MILIFLLNLMVHQERLHSLSGLTRKTKIKRKWCVEAYCRVNFS